MAAFWNARPARGSSGMKLLFDMFPVVLFFLAYTAGKHAPQGTHALVAGLLGTFGGADVSMEQAPILLATAVAIVATAAQVGWLLARGRKVDRMLWVSLAIIVVMGGATLWLRDATFIKWKPTVLYWAFAAVLLGAEFLFARNLIRAMMEKQVALPDFVWARLNWSWAAFFVAMGAINLFVAYRFSESTWVNFKLFGGIGLMVLFVLVQGIYLSRYVQSGDSAEAEDGK
jgi:intracellular septation protein